MFRPVRQPSFLCVAVRPVLIGLCMCGILLSANSLLCAPRRVAADSLREMLSPEIQQAITAAAAAGAQQAVSDSNERFKRVLEESKEAAQRLVAPLVARQDAVEAELRTIRQRLEANDNDVASVRSGSTAATNPYLQANRHFRAARKLLEIKGFIQDWKNPDATAITTAEFEHWWSVIGPKLGDLAAVVDLAKTTEALDRRLLNYKILLFLKSPDDAVAKQLREALEELFKDAPNAINARKPLISYEAEEWQVPLKKMTGKIHTMMEEFTIAQAAYKVEWVGERDGVKCLRRGGATGGGGRPATVFTWHPVKGLKFNDAEWRKISKGNEPADAELALNF